jgi:polyisoprenoid-binding protein YceI
MRRGLKPTVLFLALFALCGEGRAQPQWQVVGGSVTFEVKNAGLPVRGSFTGLEAEVRFVPETPERSVISASIDASTVDTGIGLRNKHLLKQGYFHVGEYPRIRMESVRFEKKDDGSLSGTFRLNIKEIHQEVTFPITFTPHAPGGSLEGSFTINRLDFGIGKPSAILDDAVMVFLSVELFREDAR